MRLLLPLHMVLAMALAAASPALGARWPSCPAVQFGPLEGVPPFGGAEPDSPAESRSLHERAGDVLRLRTAAGVVELRNRVNCGPLGFGDDMTAGCAYHTLVGHFAGLGGFLVHAAYWEIDGYIWIDSRTGVAAELPGMPHFRPDGSGFVVVSADDLGFNGIEVRALPGAVPEWSVENPEENGRLLYPRFAGWDVDGSVRLCVVDAAGGPGEAPALLRRGPDSGWRIERVRQAVR